jgi:hypothetical protein
MSFRIVGWLFPLVSLIALAFLSLFPDLQSRVVELVLPLSAALQAAFLFAPDDEPALELLLSSPRPSPWLIYERLAALLVMQVSIGVVWSLLISGLPGMPSVSAQVIAWLPPTLALVGLSAAVTFMMRRSSFGLLAAIFIYGAVLFAGDSAVMRWNFLYPVHLFMPREGAFFLALLWNASPDALYFVNRAVVTLIGIICIAWIVYTLRDEEKVLGVQNRGQ